MENKEVYGFFKSFFPFLQQKVEILEVCVHNSKSQQLIQKVSVWIKIQKIIIKKNTNKSQMVDVLVFS